MTADELEQRVRFLRMKGLPESTALTILTEVVAELVRREIARELES